MGSCDTGDHTTGDNIHTDITTYAPRNHSRNTAYERSVKEYLGRGSLKPFC